MAIGGVALLAKLTSPAGLPKSKTPFRFLHSN